MPLSARVMVVPRSTDFSMLISPLLTPP